MTCDRCHADFEKGEDVLEVRLKDPTIGTTTMKLCTRCGVFIIGVLGGTQSLTALKAENDLMVDILGLQLDEVRKLGQKLVEMQPTHMLKDGEIVEFDPEAVT